MRSMLATLKTLRSKRPVGEELIQGLMRGTYNPMTDELPGVFRFGLRDPNAQAAGLTHCQGF